jgi:cytochrome P450
MVIDRFYALTCCFFQDMFAAGSETSSTTLNWCMTELVRSPAVMAKAQAEVREAWKGKTMITEDDLEGLSYLKLVIKEALRLHCPLPLLLPRQCRETCQVMGYDIPKGTSVFINAWAICRDPKYWDDAEEFKPERFEKNSIDYKGTNYEFLPFGSGRRMHVPRDEPWIANVELALASLVYHFDWKLPEGMEPKDVDIWEASGLIGKKNTGLIVHPVTRSSYYAYSA